MLKVSSSCTKVESNYSSCTGRSSEKLYCSSTALEEALRRKKYVQDETQFTTKIGGKKASLGPSYFTM